eukprot:CAMPEP_0116856140 /NCGR_PEP_ID=MMETSP0418-20121206/19722_1 /TAXON_ID=1158023 /ORGANISM="Astrosyne radiata, Strain 13vi08-1A" /LENGTH=73 /DNA_ID=CAMNT_0004489459 /DNA_START=21 /DNA_END=239 /DNA_ORIENTATION=-
MARQKIWIYVALLISQLTKMDFPLLSAVASTHVDSHQQGQVQGALFAWSALANAIGPEFMQWIYHYTKSGTMF